MSNYGIVYGDIIDGRLIPVGWKIAKTAKGKNKQVLVSSDTVSRCRDLHQTLQHTINWWQPKVIFAELPTGSKSSAAAKSYGISCYSLATVSPPPILVTPVAVKKSTVGSKSASKQAMMSYAQTNYPDFPYDLKADGSLKITTMEHICDAICIAECGMATDQFKQLVSMI